MTRLDILKSIAILSLIYFGVLLILKEGSGPKHKKTPWTNKDNSDYIYANSTFLLWRLLEMDHPEVEYGGQWSPKYYKNRQNLSIIVPYRDRRKHLYYFLKHIHPFLQKQKVAYTIYVVEQAPGKTFNRGLIKNIGFLEASKLDSDHDCTVFHDVDLLPIDYRNLYICSPQPRHLCLGVDNYKNYTPLYLDDYARFGGVVALQNSQFRSLNGYSNLYVGWGAEDDDLFMRLRYRNLSVLRYKDEYGRYNSLKHTSESGQQVSNYPVNKFKLLRVATHRLDVDGLNSTRYKVLSISREKLYTRIQVDIEEDWYITKAIEGEKLYNALYGWLSPYRWEQLKFTPQPYWWKEKLLEKYSILFGW